jgi:hypothetical protein
MNLTRSADVDTSPPDVLTNLLLDQFRFAKSYPQVKLSITKIKAPPVYNKT